MHVLCCWSLCISTDALACFEVPAPFVPELTAEDDASCFLTWGNLLSADDDDDLLDSVSLEIFDTQ